MSVRLDIFEKTLELLENKKYNFKIYLDALVDESFIDLWKEYGEKHFGDGDYGYYEWSVSNDVLRMLISGNLFRDQRYFDWIGDYNYNSLDFDLAFEFDHVRNNYDSMIFLINKLCKSYDNKEVYLSDQILNKLMKHELYDVVRHFTDSKEKFDMFLSRMYSDNLERFIELFEGEFSIDVDTLVNIRSSYSFHKDDNFNLVLERVEKEDLIENLHKFDDDDLNLIVQNKKINIMIQPLEVKKKLFRFKYPDYVDMFVDIDDDVVDSLKNPDRFSHFFDMDNFRDNTPEHWPRFEKNTHNSKKWFKKNKQIMDMIESVRLYIDKYQDEQIKKYRSSSGGGGLSGLISFGIQDRILMESDPVLMKALGEFSKYCGKKYPG